MKQYLTVEKAAESLGVGQTTIYRLVKDRQISALRIRGAIRITEDALEEFIRNNTVTAGGSRS